MQKALQKKSKNRKAKDVTWESYFPQKGHFFNITCVRAPIWHEATSACINHVDSQEHGWKPSDEGFIAVGTEDDIVPELLLLRMQVKQLHNMLVQVQLEWYSLLGSV